MVASKVISLKRVEDIIAKVEKEPTQKSIAHFIKIFRICVSQNEDENADELEENKNEQDFIIEDGAVYDKVVTFALQRFPYLLKKLLKLENGQILESVSSRKLDIVLKVYLLNIVKMAENVHEEDMLIYMLTFYPIITDFMFPLKKLFMRFLKYMVELWATNNNLKLKLKAFIIIRRICKNTKSEEVDKIFRRVYAAYFENVRHVSWRTYESVIFMINCYSELMVEHKDAAYYIGFSYLRQIAVLLKDNMAKKGDEMKVFNWQVINSLKLWSQTISRQPADEDLGQLLYPLVELIIGVNQFSNSQEYVPLKFHLIQCLNTIAQKTSTFIPTLKVIKDVLNSGEFRKKKTQSTKKPFDFSISLKIDSKYKNTNVLWNEIFKYALDLSAEYLAIYSRDIGFPEMCYNYIVYLKKLQDSVQFVVYKMQIKQLLKTIRASVDLVLNKRKGVNFAPKNIELDAKFSEDSFKDVKETPLEQLRNKIVTERETRVKQRILAERDQNYDEGDDAAEDDAEGGDDDEDVSGDESEYDDGTDKKKKKVQKDLDIADESDSDAFDPENYKDSDEEEENQEDEDEYDLDNMDYEGDPDDLPDFDLIDENDNNNDDDDNQLSEDDFDNEDEEEEEGEGEGDNEEEEEEKPQKQQNIFEKSIKNSHKQKNQLNQQSGGKKNKKISKNRNKNNKIQRGKNQRNFKNNKKQNSGKRRK